MAARRITFALSILIASLVALCASAYLAWTSLQAEGVVGCGVVSAFECDEVLTSRWARSFGLPVALLAAPSYLAILALLWPAVRNPGAVAMTVLLALAVAAMTSAVWFVGLQAFVLESYCLYCVIAHVCGLIVGFAALMLALDGRLERDPGQMRSLLGVGGPQRDTSASGSQRLSGGRVTIAVAVALLSVAAMATGQLLEEEAVLELQEITIAPPTGQPTPNETPTEEVASAVDEPPAESLPEETATVSRTFQFTGMDGPVDLSDMPVLGNPRAEVAMVELLDYTCKHCRELHPYVHQAVDRYGDQLAVVVCHVPLSSNCNPHAPQRNKGKPNTCDLARLAISVWRQSPAEFEEFHNWLMDGDRPPRIVDARKRAIGLFGDQFLLNNKLKAEANQRIPKQCAVLNRLQGGLPVLLFPDSAMRGVPKTKEAFYQLLESKLGLAPPAAPAG